MNPAPFTFQDKDVVLNTSDGVSLNVHSRILIEASPFFRDLFTLPQRVRTSPMTVDIPEEGKVAHTLMMLIYPIEEPPIDSLSLLNDLLGAAIKYDMALPIQTLRRLLVSSQFIKTEPLRVYAIASRHNLMTEAKLASAETLTFNILDAPLAEELKDITAYDYHRLLSLHHTRGIEAQKLLIWDPKVRCSQCIGAATRLSANIPHWWTKFVAHAKAELQRAPTTDVIFSLEFLAQVADEDCLRCGSSILDSRHFLEKLRRSIDMLPTTIE